MSTHLTLIHGGDTPVPPRKPMELPPWFLDDKRVSMRRKMRAKVAERSAPTVTVTVAEGKTDYIRHREEYKSFRFEVWQSAQTVFTERPLFYSLRWNLITRTKAKPRREDHFQTAEAAIRETKRIIDRQRMFLGNEPPSPKPRRRKKRSLPIPPDERRLIEHITDTAEILDPGPDHAFVPPDASLPADVLAAIQNQ